ncbi:MAG TPA: universal stress protein [Bacteroidota bacterium]|nr:universal stress protein [Bacteroidota bacterium]
MFKKLLVGYDGSEGAKFALEKALQLSQALHAEVCALWVRGSLPHYPETVDEVEEEREAADSFLQRIRRMSLRSPRGSALR